MNSLIYREMTAGEEQEVFDLVREVFMKYVAPDYREEGVREFFRFADPEKMRQRMQSGGFVLLACRAQKIVGMVEFVPPERIAMLFVSVQHQGIASELVRHAANRARTENSNIKKITAHSSPYAVPFYLKIGFCKTGEAVADHGIKYIPVELRIFDKSA